MISSSCTIYGCVIGFGFRLCFCPGPFGFFSGGVRSMCARSTAFESLFEFIYILLVLI